MSVDGSDGRHSDRDDEVVVRKSEHGWVVGEENVSDLTSAMVLADLFAADQAAHGSAAAPPSPAAARREGPEESAGRVRDKGTEPGAAARLAVTVTQLEHALASRVRVEQAIGVLAERHRLRPREAFDLLRRAARSRGRRVTEIAQDVVASTANPLLRLPEELARKRSEPRPRGGRSLRHPRHAAKHA
ncbi:MAG TPA: ANTAR domain-containing protein [Trebonia sp.]|nr:ANTAR domain-containing protein [Trebonia sp.]